MSDPVNVGILGCGVISEIYLKNLTERFAEVRVLGCFDLSEDAMRARSEQFALPRRYASYEEMLGDEDIDIVLNLSPPLAHFALSKLAIEAGKHVYTEKPLGVSFEEASALVALAKEHGVRLGSSPDVPLGAGVQTCRKLIEDGYIGEVVGFNANLIKRGVETWHPNPDFLYQPGAGPMLDMAPYYLSALVQLLGPIRDVEGMSAISFRERTITSQPRYGQTIQVNVPTYVNALLRMQSGVPGTFTATFDVHKANLPYLEIYGAEGTLSCPYPNDFGGPISIWRPGQGDEWLRLPEVFGYGENSRGLGLADMAKALRTGREHRANADVACHVIEAIDRILQSCERGERLALSAPCAKPLPMARGGVPGILD